MYVANGVVDVTNMSILCPSKMTEALNRCAYSLYRNASVGYVWEDSASDGGICVCVGLQPILFPCGAWYECMWLFFNVSVPVGY